jgi:hypothetical protein
VGSSARAIAHPFKRSQDRRACPWQDNSSQPESRYSGEAVRSEEVPEGWRDSGVGQVATESLLASDSSIKNSREE